MSPIEQSKEKLQKDGYCMFDLKDFNVNYSNFFEKIKYKTSDNNYLKNFTAMKFDYHNQESNTHYTDRVVFKTFEEASKYKEELLKNYDYENINQIWHQAETLPSRYGEMRFNMIFYDILEYFYKETKLNTNIGLQWTCYSEGCFLKDHNDGEDEEYQNTCAILIYLNEEWDESWGGNLILRNTKNQKDDDVVAYKVIPTFGKVAIIDLKTFDTSHAVERVNGNHNRCTLLAFTTSKTPKIKLDKTIT